MQTITLDKAEFPTLSTWNPELLDEILENLSKTANPSKPEITIKDKLWAAQMLEMDLQSQGSTIPETEPQEDSLTEHNRAMLQRIRETKTEWAESYPGEHHP